MIPTRIQKTVLRLWKKGEKGGWSQRQIAEQLSLSRGTVAVIIRRGKVLKPSPASGKPLRPTMPAAIRGQLDICPKCGRHVVLPCLECMVTRRPHPGSQKYGKLQLELQPEDELRRLEITARHRQQ